jgi:thioredoxin 1
MMRNRWNMSNRARKALVIIGLLAAIAVVIFAKHIQNKPDRKGTKLEVAGNSGLPRLVDLGAHKCIPCKMMAPILEELKTEYAGRFKVDFIDVWENPDVGAEYDIRMIPTQIFYDASGKELFRHEGFFSKADILTKWKELGIEIETKQE